MPYYIRGFTEQAGLTQHLRNKSAKKINLIKDFPVNADGGLGNGMWTTAQAPHQSCLLMP